MPSREQRHLTFSLSLSFSLPSPDLRGTKNLSSPVPFLFPRSRHRWRDEIVQYYTLNYPYPLSLSLVNMVKWWCKLDRCVTYVRYNFKDIDS